MAEHEVTQADCDLVYSLMLPAAKSTMERRALEYVKAGRGNDAAAVQEVAAHRIAHTAPLEARVKALEEENECALDMLRWALAALDSGYRSTRAKQEIEKIDAFFAARKARAALSPEGTSHDPDA